MLRPLTSVYRLRILSARPSLVQPQAIRQFASTIKLSAQPRNFNRPNHDNNNNNNSPPLFTQHRQNGQAFTDSYHLSERIQLLSRRSPSQLASAVQLVKDSPPHIATVVPWNVLLHECFFYGKFKLAYDCWMDMKRRGVKPTARSFGTFFNGCGRMKGSSGGVEGLARVRTVWQQWLVHAERTLERGEEERAVAGGKRWRKGVAAGVESVAGENQAATDSAEDITNLPSNNFLSFLAKTDQIALLLETFHSMPDSGPLAPDVVTYSIVLSALRPLIGSPSATPAESAAHFADAFKVWDRLAASADIHPDTETVSLLISICRSSPVPADHLKGLELAQEWFGLLPPSEAHQLATPSLAPPKVGMDSAALSNVLTLVTKVQKYNLVVEWFDQVRDHPKRFGDVVEHWQCDLVLVALGYKKDAQGAEDLIEWMQRSKSLSLQPTLATWTNALQVCWRAADLARACRLLAKMTGRSIPSATSSVATAEDDVVATAETPLTHPPRTDTFAPDARTVSTLLQTALATRDRGNIARTLAIADNLGFGLQAYTLEASTPIREADEDGDERERRPQRQRAERDPHHFFWQFKLAEVVERSLERVLQGGEGHLSSERRRELVGWRRGVVEWLEAKDEVGKESRRGTQDGEESMRKRREGLGIGANALRGRERKWRSQPAEEEGEEGDKRLNRKQRRMLARGDSIEPVATRAAVEERAGDDGFVVSSRASEEAGDAPARSPRPFARADDFNEDGPRERRLDPRRERYDQDESRERRSDSRAPRSYERRDDDRAPRRFDRREQTDAPRRFDRRERDQDSDRPPRQSERGGYNDRSPRRFSQERDAAPRRSERGEFDERPARRFSQDREERPRRSFGDRNDEGRRPHQGRDSPPHRSSGGRPERRSSDFGDRGREDRGGGSRQRGWDD